MRVLQLIPTLGRIRPTGMPKTPLILDARRRISDLGDQLHYMAFATRLVDDALASVPAKARQEFTPAVFRSNEKARAINVRVVDLPAFAAAALLTGFGAVVTAAYEACDSYLTELPSLLGRLGRSTLAYTTEEVSEDTLYNVFQAAGLGVDRERIETLQYLRLRRNQIAHLRAEPTRELASLVRNRGTFLSRYWDYSGPPDFSAEPLPTVHEREAIGLLRLMRILLDDLDETAATFLDINRVIEDLHGDLLEAAVFLRGLDGRRRRARKIETLLDILYGMELDWVEIELRMPAE
jgi:hypothetical protein